MTSRPSWRFRRSS
ncbi:hypothetical protein LEMLEM_LOCUS27824 [Lemmus lemmus]